MSPATPSLKKNVVANYLGYAWRTAINLAFVPVYIRFLGVEAYGLIGVFATLQILFGLLDIGLRPALSREMARSTAGVTKGEVLRDLLRSVEAISVGTALFTAGAIGALSGWLAHEWVRPDALSPETVAHAFLLMGVVTGLRFMEGLYTACLVGLQRQVLENGLSSAMAGLRALGAVGVLMFVSNSILAFFVWQVFVSLLTSVLLGVATYRRLPPAGRPARFSWPALRSIWRFAAGTLAIMVLSIILTQADKVILSRLLPLETFGYYVLAAVVAGSLTSVAAPITTAFYPRFTHLVAMKDEVGLRTAYHQASQLIAVVAGSVAITLIAFAEPLLLIWTGDARLASAVAPIMAFLVLGTLFNSLMMNPYHLQLAHGWLSLSIQINIVAVLIVIPGILLAVPRFGAVGAAAIWAGLNTGYLLVGIGLMHRRLLPEEKWKWYLHDNLAPLGAGASVAIALRFIAPDLPDRALLFLQTFICAGLILVATVLAAPETRTRALKIALRVFGRNGRTAS